MLSQVLAAPRASRHRVPISQAQMAAKFGKPISWLKTVECYKKKIDPRARIPVSLDYFITDDDNALQADQRLLLECVKGKEIDSGIIEWETPDELSKKIVRALPLRVRKAYPCVFGPADAITKDVERMPKKHEINVDHIIGRHNQSILPHLNTKRTIVRQTVPTFVASVYSPIYHPPGLDYARQFEQAQSIWPGDAVVFVGNLNAQYTDHELAGSVENIFEQYGTVFVKVQRTNDGKHIKPWAVLQFTTVETASRAVGQILATDEKGHRINGRYVRTAISQANRSVYAYGPLLTIQDL